MTYGDHPTDPEQVAPHLGRGVQRTPADAIDQALLPKFTLVQGLAVAAHDIRIKQLYEWSTSFKPSVLLCCSQLKTDTHIA